jgi:hypothetical protein
MTQAEFLLRPPMLTSARGANVAAEPNHLGGNDSRNFEGVKG